MKKLLGLIVLGVVVFVVVYRQRLFLRDPLATVTRNGVKVGDVGVMINYSNDVLLDDDSTATRRLYLVQHGNAAAGVPTAVMKCVQGLGCMTDADRATVALLTVRRDARPVAMTDRVVEFVDEDGVAVKVTLR